MSTEEQIYQNICQEQFEEAIRLYEKLDESQKNPDLTQTMALIYCCSEDTVKQQHALPMILSIKDQIADVMDYHEDLSTIYVTLGMWDEYEQLARQCIQMVKDDLSCDPDDKLASITEFYDDGDDESPQQTASQHDPARIDQLIALVQKRAHLPCNRITLLDLPCSVYDSKVGGTPYHPIGADYPHAEDGSPLRFLAQIRLDEMPPLDDFPSTGMLQFYIKDMYEDDEGRVIYHEQVDESIAQQDIPVPNAEDGDDEDDQLPFAATYCRRMSFTPIISPHPQHTGRICVLFNSCWDEVFPEEKGGYEELYLRDPESDERIAEACEGGDAHLVGGYGHFTQDDPCDSDEHRAKSIQLLQLDSQDGIMWADCGLGHFFISPEKLRLRDFSDCLFYWDCY